ncbi:ABC transporter permease [Nocardia sp. NPDC058658]|uniref:ABC transporter permease n=1 Tax=Nocardia sp. NPDC058658 TaxID=3346580 RepID=UPI00365FEF98
MGRPTLALARGAFGAGVLLAGWFAAAYLLGARRGVPTPESVLRWSIDARTTIGANISHTADSAARGYLIGTVIAIAVAIVAFTVRRLERTLVSVAVMSYCLPLVAVAPLLRITLDGAATEVTLAALCVFFTTMLGVLSGLRAAPRVPMEVVASLGGRGWAQLRYARLPAALGPTLTALSLAAPLAILGAVLGEFLGGEAGLGVGLIDAQKTGDPARAWSYCLAILAVALVATALINVAARVLAPWHYAGSRS